MRTITTQLRLRRFLRAYRDYAARLRAERGDPRLAGAARARLLELAADIHGAWATDARTIHLAPVRAHVARELAELARQAGAFGTAGDAAADTATTGEVGLALLLMLRGLDDLPDRQVLDWLGIPELAKTA